LWVTVTYEVTISCHERVWITGLRWWCSREASEHLETTTIKSLPRTIHLFPPTVPRAM
jgi:hypothetical protein